MKNHLQHKAKGNTIMEVLVALSIISFCASLAVVIYLNIQKSSTPFFKLKAVELTEKYLNQTINLRQLEETTFKEEEFSVKRTLSAHPLFPDCYVVRIIVFDASKKKLHEAECVIKQGK